MELVLNHLPAITGFIIAGLLVALAWGVRKIGLEKAFEDAIIDFVKRGLDKSKERLVLAVDPASPGGASLTADELSEIRQLVFDYVSRELRGGPLAKLVIQWGEERIKGYIGDRLAERGVRLDTSEPEETA